DHPELDLTYTLFIKAENELEALAAVDARALGGAEVAERLGSVHAVTMSAWSKVEVADDIRPTRAITELDLNEWRDRDWAAFQERSAFSPGGLLAWRRGPRR